MGTPWMQQPARLSARLSATFAGGIEEIVRADASVVAGTHKARSARVHRAHGGAVGTESVRHVATCQIVDEHVAIACRRGRAALGAAQQQRAAQKSFNQESAGRNYMSPLAHLMSHNGNAARPVSAGARTPVDERSEYCASMSSHYAGSRQGSVSSRLW